MATQTPQGWRWTRAERQWIKTWRRGVKTQSRWFTEQVDRFQQELPAFADEAAKTAQPYLSAVKALLTLANGAERRTYQSMAPDDAKNLLSGAYHCLSAWSAFTRRADVQAALKIEAQKRALRKQMQALRAQFAESSDAKTVEGLTPPIPQEIADALFDQLIPDP